MGSLFGVAVIVGTALTASAQNPTREYRDWQKAQREAQRERRDYQRTRNARDYREWQNAERRVQQEYAQYQRAQPGYNRGSYNNNVNRRYRVLRNGSYYSTDARGAELLRSAVNNGYSQGYRQGQLDRQYRRGSNYGNSSLYRSGTYGYQSHVARNQYQHYFQQGFQRGYEDGYNSTYRYGTRSGNGFNILGNVLSGILNIIN